MKQITRIISLFICLNLHAQVGHISISGQIVDLESNKPVSFATINLLNKPIGVVANDAGEFAFTFSEAYLADTIVFSSAGYQSEKLLAQSIANTTDLTIELGNKAVVLSEVVVTNKELNGWEILEIALNNVKNNYPVDPFEFKAFYRDYKQEDEKCISIFEAAISAYDRGYSKVKNKFSLKEKVVLEQVRKSLAVPYRTHAFRRVNVMNEILRLNDVRYQSRALDKKASRLFTYALDGYAIINDRLMYKIKAKEDWTYFIYVDVVSYAIPRIEMNYHWIEGIHERQWTLGDTIYYKQTQASMLLDFQLINGRYYPKYCSFSADLEAYDFDKEQLLFTSYLLQEYMVTDIDFNPMETPDKSLRMDPYEMIENQAFTYDPEFWKHYNVIKVHPRDEALIKGLEESMEIDEQFSTLRKE